MACVPNTAINKIRAGRMDQKGPACAGQEYRQVSCHGHLQVHHRLDVRMVEMKNLSAKVKQAENGDGADDAQYRGDPQHQAHVPGFGLIPVINVVIGNRQDRAVVEQRDASRS